MQWYRKAQIAWFAVFSVILLAVAWLALPVARLSTSTGTALVLDHVMYTAIALVLAGLLAVAAGAESDYQSALRRYGFSSTETFDANKAMIYWMRVGAIVFILVPFVLVALEAEGHLRPITWLRSLFEAHAAADGIGVFSLLYQSVYGLCVTLLAIDFFLTPLSAQVVREETTATARDALLAQTYEISSRFLETMNSILAQNLPELRGTPAVWTRLNGVTAEIGTIKKSAAMLPIGTSLKELTIGHIGELQSTMEGLVDFPKFLSNFSKANPRAGRRNFRGVHRMELALMVDDLRERIDNICTDFGLAPAQADKHRFDAAARTLCSDWERVRAAALAHYNIKT